MSLKIDRLTKSFNGLNAVENISLEVRPGEIVGILGTSGCGKSTLLRTVSGLDRNYDGAVWFDGKKSEGVEKSTGFIFQEPRLLPWLSVLENVTVGLSGKKGEAKEKALHYLKLVGLEGSEKLYPRELSGGMAQRVAIARSLVTDPKLLLLDEPFSALDAFTKMQLQELLLEIWETKQTTMLLVTHDIEEALYLCDRIVIMKGQPGRYHHELTIEQERPRKRGSTYLAELKTDILARLDLTEHKRVI